MKNFKNTPAFVRYFKARFKPFTKPLFLGSFGGLLIAGLAIYQYWKHPEWLRTSDDTTIQQETNSSDGITSPSPEDLSVAADIDNSDLLLKELEQNQGLNEVNPNENKDRVKIEKKDTEYSRFQEAQKDKLQNSTSLNSDLDSSGIKTENQKITELLQPPSFSSYQSTGNLPQSSIKKFEGSKVKVIPNPIGNVYLSNRKNKQRSVYLQPVKTKPVQRNTANESPTTDSNGLDSSVNSTQESNVVNDSFVPASSVIQSQTTRPSPVVRSNVSTDTTSFNVTNPYLGSGFNSTNSYPTNGLSSIPQNNLNSNLGNLPNSSYNNNMNSVGGFNYSESTNGNNNSNSLQNNYSSPQLTTPNYNRSVPSGYQLQPQGYTQNQNNSVPRNNGLSRTPTVSNVNVDNNSNSPNQQTNSASGINSYTTPSLQPSGVLTTGETRR